MIRMNAESVSGLQHGPRKALFSARFVRAILFFVAVLLPLYNSYAASFSVVSTPNSQVIGETIYYTTAPSLILVASDVNGDYNVLINGSVVKTIASDGNYTLAAPTSPFELGVERDGNIAYDANFTPVKLSISDVSVVLQTQQPEEESPVRFKVTLTNDGTADSLQLVVRVRDGHSTVLDQTYSLDLPANESITKYLSFTPPHAGTYTITADVLENGLQLAEQVQQVIVSVSRPDVSLDVSPTEVTLPADVLATVNIQNGPVERNYTVSLSVYGPDGSQVFTRTKSAQVSANGSRTVVFPVSLGPDFPPGPYSIMAHVTFSAGSQSYAVDAQRTVTAASDVPSMTLSIRVPEKVQVDQTFRFIAEFHHQSTRTYTYRFQCYVYDPDGVPLLSVPSVPAEVTLQPKEITAMKYEYTVPSGWQEGQYSISCRAWRQGGEWTDEKQFTVEIPPDYVTFFVRAYLQDGKVHASACYSTEAMKPLDATIMFKYRTDDGVLFADGPIRVKLGNSVECVSSSWAPPQFVDPRKVSVSAVLRYSGGEIEKTSTLGAERSDVVLQCDRNVVTPEDPKITCTLYANDSGVAVFGAVPSQVSVPPVLDGAKQVLSAEKEVNVNRTAVVTLSLAGVRFQNAKIVTVYRDSEGFVTVKDFPVQVVPVAAVITSVQTFTKDYYRDDQQKPVVGQKEDFYQDVTVCSRSAEPITVKVVADTPNDLVATALTNTVTLELAPKQCVTKTFVFRTGRYVPSAPIGITYSVYLEKSDREFLLSSKTYRGPASSDYYAMQNARPTVVSGRLVVLAVAGIILAIGLAYWITRGRRKVKEVTAYEPSVQGEDHAR